MKTNTRPTPTRSAPATAPDPRMDTTARLAGGAGQMAAKQPADELLRRVMLSQILWEDKHYEGNSASAQAIRDLVPQVASETCARIAREARFDQGLRHAPLFLAVQMLKHPEHRLLVADLLTDIVNRADEITETLAMYWSENPAPDGKRHAPLAAQLKVGLRHSFAKFDHYQLAKYQGKGHAVPMAVAVKLLRPRPTQRNAQFFEELKAGKVTPPDTWEVALSKGEDKTATFERLIAERRLGGQAFLRNLRLMENSGVSRAAIENGFKTVSVRWLMPIDFVRAAKAQPRYQAQIEELMFRGMANGPILPGETVMIVDTSGSMGSSVSANSDMTWREIAATMAMFAVEASEKATVYVTAGDDNRRVHATALVPSRHGWALRDAINETARRLGVGGIFTSQALEFVKADRRGERAARVIVFSDSQDCDRPEKRVPDPSWASRSYICDVSSHSRGINYEGVWTAEIAGWSQNFLRFIAAYEGKNVATDEDVDE